MMKTGTHTIQQPTSMVIGMRCFGMSKRVKLSKTMINLIDDFETRIRILSKSLRKEVDKNKIIEKIKNHYHKSDPLDLDGRTSIDSLKFENETEDFLVEGRRGPSAWIGKYLAELFPTKRIHVTWLSIDWKSGSIIYEFDNGELFEDIRKYET